MILIILKLFVKKLKDGIRILVDKAVFESLINTCKVVFLSVTQELLSLLKYQGYFWVLQTICFIILFFKIVMIILRQQAQNILNFGLGCSSSLSFLCMWMCPSMLWLMFWFVHCNFQIARYKLMIHSVETHFIVGLNPVLCGNCKR